MSDANNCILCGEEFNDNELYDLVPSLTLDVRFKVCKNCLKISNPDDDFRQARDIIKSYLEFSTLKEIKKIIKT